MLGANMLEKDRLKLEKNRLQNTPMLVDTHCHLNIIVKQNPDTFMTKEELAAAETYINHAIDNNVSIIINVGTSLSESLNCLSLSQQYPNVYAAVGIHPTDCSTGWKSDIAELTKLLKSPSLISKYTPSQNNSPHTPSQYTPQNRPTAEYTQTNNYSDTGKKHIVGIGETGIDRYHPGYDSKRQADAFKAQIDLALAYDLALIVHSRDAADETLTILDEYKRDIKRATMHCFSYDQSIANDCLKMGFMLGIGGTVTYKKNDVLRAIVQSMPLENIVLETDAPFLAPQIVRGQQNQPKYIKAIAEFIAELRSTTLDEIATQTTLNARKLFDL